MSDFQNSKMVKARKDHKCDCCQSKIWKNSEYQYTSGVQDGDFYVYKLCTYCRKILSLEAAKQYPYGDGIDIENFLGDSDAVLEYYNILKVRPMKSQWLQLILAHWKSQLLVDKLYEIKNKLEDLELEQLNEITLEIDPFIKGLR